jgi:hypothetical protein
MPLKISKLADAFFTEAVPVRELKARSLFFMLLSPFWRYAKKASSRYQRKHGGLWVGGRIEIAESALSFSANSLNRDIHEEIPEVNIPIGEIESVVYKFGWITGIVLIYHRRGVFRFRCYGAKRLVDEINGHVKEL